MGQTESKREGLAIAGTTSAATTGAGITLIVVGGPVGVFTGGVILGAGISGAVSTTKQALSDEKEFNYTKWGV